MQIRPFGRTGESFPILSFGAQRIVDEERCNEEQALAMTKDYLGTLTKWSEALKGIGPKVNVHGRDD